MQDTTNTQDIPGRKLHLLDLPDEILIKICSLAVESPTSMRPYLSRQRYRVLAHGEKHAPGTPCTNLRGLRNCLYNGVKLWLYPSSPHSGEKTSRRAGLTNRSLARVCRRISRITRFEAVYYKVNWFEFDTGHQLALFFYAVSKKKRNAIQSVAFGLPSIRIIQSWWKPGMWGSCWRSPFRITPSMLPALEHVALVYNRDGCWFDDSPAPFTSVVQAFLDNLFLISGMKTLELSWDKEFNRHATWSHSDMGFANEESREFTKISYTQIMLDIEDTLRKQLTRPKGTPALPY